MGNLAIALLLNGTPNIDTMLQKIAEETKCKLTVTSGYRSKKHNKRVGGAKGSYHLKDRARDFTVSGANCSLESVSKVACKYVTTITYSRHIHIDNRANKVCFSGKYRRTE